MKVPPQAIHHSKCSLADKKQSYYSLSVCCHEGWLHASTVSGPLAKLALLDRTLGFGAEPWAAACEALVVVALVAELDDTPRPPFAIGIA